jgi:hypothetical protein
MKRRQSGFGLLWILAAIVVVAVIGLVGWKVASKNSSSNNQSGFSGSTNNGSAKTANPGDAEPVITASPVDPAQIQWVSKFRSCAGHEYYSTPDYNSLTEGDSNMKHYFYVASQYLNSGKSVKLYAPFDGTVHFMEIGGTGKGAIIEHQPFDGWYVAIYHVDPSVADGATLKSGQLLGYDHLTGGIVSFDMAMQRFKTPTDPQSDLLKNLESIFDHMDSNVSAQWAAHGITTANIIVDRAYRAANSCQCAANQPQQAAGFKSSECYFESSPDDKVTTST